MSLIQTTAKNNRQHLPSILRKAAIHLRGRDNIQFLTEEPGVFTTFELAALVEQLADRVASGDDTVGLRLWRIFAPTSTWDDAGGDSLLGEAAFQIIDSLFRPA